MFADGHGSTLDVVKERGNLLCGVSTGSPGFSGVDDSGMNVGFDVDYCRALAAAIFNDPMANTAKAPVQINPIMRVANIAPTRRTDRSPKSKMMQTNDIDSVAAILAP